MKVRNLAAPAALALAASASADLLYDNGNWVSTPATWSGTTVTTPGSSVRLNENGDFGWPAEWLPNNTFDSAADDFTISAVGGMFQAQRIRLFAYESGATSTNLTITGAYLRIWNEKPSGPRLGANDGRIVAGFIGTGATEADKMLPMATVAGDPLNGPGMSTWTGIYRRGTNADTGTARPVQAVDFDVSAFPILNNGTYWLEVAMLGSTAGQQAWVPTFDVNGSRAVDISGGNYVDAVGAGTGGQRPSIDFAFQVYGQSVPEPGTIAALSLGAAAMLRRRKK